MVAEVVEGTTTIRETVVAVTMMATIVTAMEAAVAEAIAIRIVEVAVTDTTDATIAEEVTMTTVVAEAVTMIGAMDIDATVSMTGEEAATMVQAATDTEVAKRIAGETMTRMAVRKTVSMKEMAGSTTTAKTNAVAALGNLLLELVAAVVIITVAVAAREMTRHFLSTQLQ